MYSQAIIRCYTKAKSLPNSFENLTDQVSQMWVCEANTESVKVAEVHLWIISKIEELEDFQKKHSIDFSLAVFLEIESLLSPYLIQLEPSLLNVLSRNNATLEVFISEG